MNTELFLQADRAGEDAFVATSPLLPSPKDPSMPPDVATVQKMLRDLGTPAWAKAVRRSAMPWAQTMGFWLLGLPEEAARSAICTLGRVAFRGIAALDTIDRTRGRLLASLLGQDSSRVEVELRGKTFVDCDGEWFIEDRGHLVDFANFSIALEQFREGVSGHKTAVGHILRKGELPWPFDVPLDTFCRSPRRCAFDAIPYGKVTAIVIPCKLENDLADLAIRFAEARGDLRTSQRIDRVGWVEGRGLVFPRFRISEGKIIPEIEKDLDLEDIPARQLAPPTIKGDLPRSLFAVNDTTAFAWAYLAAVFQNIVEQSKGRETRGIAVLSWREAEGREQVGEISLRSLAKILDLPFKWVSPEYPGGRPYRPDLGHALPQILDARSNHSILEDEYVWDPNPKSITALVNSAFGWENPTAAGWVFVVGYGVPQPIAYRAMVRGLFQAVCDWQRAGMPDLIMPDTCRFLIEAASHNCAQPCSVSELIEKAASLISGDCGAPITTAPDRALFQFISWWRINLPNEADRTYPSKPRMDMVPIWMDRWNRTIRKAIKERAPDLDLCPEIDVQRVAGLLAQAGEDGQLRCGTVKVSREYWLNVLDKWRAARAIRFPGYATGLKPGGSVVATDEAVAAVAETAM